MPVRIFCPCGADVTHTVSLWDRKTRSVYWMEEHPLFCALCQAKGRKEPVLPPKRPCAGTYPVCRARASAPGPVRAPIPWPRRRAAARSKPS